MSQRVKTSVRGLVLPRSSSPENGHLRKNNQSIGTARESDHVPDLVPGLWRDVHVGDNCFSYEAKLPYG